MYILTVNIAVLSLVDRNLTLLLPMLLCSSAAATLTPTPCTGDIASSLLISVLPPLQLLLAPELLLKAIIGRRERLRDSPELGNGAP